MIALMMMAGASAVAPGSAPDGIALGIGAGWQIGPAGGTFAPNVASARIRLKNGWMLSPRFSVRRTTGETAVVVLDQVFLVDVETTTLALGSDLRVPLAKRDNVELHGIAGVDFNWLDTQGNSDVGVTLQWGVGIHWWATKHVSLSADAVNPFVSLQTAGNGSSNLGLTWDPSARVMGHLWF